MSDTYEPLFGAAQCAHSVNSFLITDTCTETVVPRRVTLGGVVAELIPPFAGDSVQVLDNSSAANGKLANKFLGAVHARAQHINEAELALLHAQNCDVGRRTD